MKAPPLPWGGAEVGLGGGRVAFLGVDLDIFCVEMMQQMFLIPIDMPYDTQVTAK